MMKTTDPQPLTKDSAYEAFDKMNTTLHVLRDIRTGFAALGLPTDKLDAAVANLTRAQQIIADAGLAIT